MNVKNLIIAFLLGLLLLLGLVIFRMVNLDSDSSELEIDREAEKVLESFFGDLSRNENENAYQLTSEEFQNAFGFEEFVNMVELSGLNDFSDKNWLSEDKGNPDAYDVLRAEFLFDDRDSSLITFVLLDEQGTLKIASISQDFSLETLAGLFPFGQELEERLRGDINLLKSTIEGGSYQRFYENLSREAKKNVSPADIESILKTFEDENKDITLPGDAMININPDFPKITDEGKVMVIGNYKNNTFLVKFNFQYAYEWGWKLNSIDLDAEKL